MQQAAKVAGSTQESGPPSDVGQALKQGTTTVQVPDPLKTVLPDDRKGFKTQEKARKLQHLCPLNLPFEALSTRPSLLGANAEVEVIPNPLSREVDLVQVSIIGMQVLGKAEEPRVGAGRNNLRDSIVNKALTEQSPKRNFTR
jgi:hypothetical protein